jgi:hypothetical protein
MKKIVILFTLFAFIYGKAHAQLEAAPSLVMGLSGIMGKKGDIDLDVLTSIITDKQNELKKEAMRRLVMNGFADGSYTFYTFANQLFNTLLNTTNKTAAQRKLMESLSNMAMVYGWTEFYLQSSKYMMKNEDLRNVLYYSSHSMLDSSIRLYWLNSLVTNSDGGNSELSTAKAQFDTASSLSSLRQIIAKNYNSIIGNIKIFEDSLRTKLGRFNPKNVFAISGYLINQLKPNGHNENDLALNEILVDMVQDIMLNSQGLDKLGFFGFNKELTDENYRLMNKYVYVIDPAKKSEVMEYFEDSTQYQNFVVYIQKLHARMSGELNLLVSSYNIVKDLLRKKLSINQLVNHYASRLSDSLRSPENGLAEYRRVVAQALHMGDSIHALTQLENGGTADSILTQVSTYNRVFKSFLYKNPEDFTNEEINYITQRAYLLETKLRAYTGNGPQYQNFIDTIYSFMMYHLVKGISSKMNSKEVKLGVVSLATFSNFINLLSNLGSLDKAASYEQVFKIAMNAGYLYDDFSNTNTFNMLITNIEKYAQIDAENNKITIDVESIILAVYDRLVAKVNKPLGLYFNIGLNTCYNVTYTQNRNLKSMLAASDTLKSFSFATEKIGLKWKLLDFKRYRAYTPGERIPILGSSCGIPASNKPKSKNPYVSNINMTVYGSGLLYNIYNVTTAGKFHSVMIGSAVGFEFFNGLEINFFVSTGVNSNERLWDAMRLRQYWGVSFDLPIIDYIQAMRKKRTDQSSKDDTKPVTVNVYNTGTKAP